ncbi:MAG: CoA pyrophosphatase [Wenzhouxiangellaceae bacterium]|nr:CoA pyrophosphatase [Wenzhouxiangellaceae bacterium]
MSARPSPGRPELRLAPLQTPLAELSVGGYCPPHLHRPRPAAVLIGIDEQPPHGVWLTLRASHLRQHAGQVAFPGGRREQHDDSPVATALREAFEETGIAPEQVRPAGFLDRYDTITGFRITPVVGWVHADRRPRPDGREVAEVFSVPLAEIADPECYRREQVRHAGQTFEILTLAHAEHHIWGATAALLYELGQRVG